MIFLHDLCDCVVYPFQFFRHRKLVAFVFIRAIREICGSLSDFNIFIAVSLDCGFNRAGMTPSFLWPFLIIGDWDCLCYWPGVRKISVIVDSGG